MKLFLFFSHTLTTTQIEYAKEYLGIDKFVYLPKELQYTFSNVPPKLECLDEYVKPFYDFLDTNATKDDYVLIQGDFGLSYLLVEYCKRNQLTSIYATTKRVSSEKNGVKVSKFEFVRFRKY